MICPFQFGNEFITPSFRANLIFASRVKASRLNGDDKRNLVDALGLEPRTR
jgi:hypothetical protein